MTGREGCLIFDCRLVFCFFMSGCMESGMDMQENAPSPVSDSCCNWVIDAGLRGHECGSVQTKGCIKVSNHPWREVLVASDVRGERGGAHNGLVGATDFWGVLLDLLTERGI